MKTFYITTTELAQAAHQFAKESHWCEISTGIAVIKMDFHSEYHESIFGAQPDVATLPHPLSSNTLATAALTKSQMAALQKVGISPSDTMADAATKLAVFHPKLRITYSGN